MTAKVLLSYHFKYSEALRLLRRDVAENSSWVAGQLISKRAFYQKKEKCLRLQHSVFEPCAWLAPRQWNNHGHPRPCTLQGA